jgi:hypothetical protein
MPAQRHAKSCPILDDFEQFWVLFAWQQRFESFALGFESSRSPAKFAKRFESSNPDSRIRVTTTTSCCSSFTRFVEVENKSRDQTQNIFSWFVPACEGRAWWIVENVDDDTASPSRYPVSGNDVWKS